MQCRIILQLTSVNIATHELHALALLCANPDAPDRDCLAGLRPFVRAMAIVILKKLSPGTYAGHPQPQGADCPPETRQEIDQAADEFLGFLMGRRSERDLCARLGSC